MNLEWARKVADAVLYEGYILYPYRASAIKNRQRWTFGGIYPPTYVQEYPGSDRCVTTTECLLESGVEGRIDVHLRFLQLQERTVGVLDDENGAVVDGHVERWPQLREVPSLQVGEQRYVPWQESVECEVWLEKLRVGDLAGRVYSHEFQVDGVASLERLPTPLGAPAGVLERRRCALSGVVEVGLEQSVNGAWKLRVSVRNCTMLARPALDGRDEALMHSLVSAHVILGVRDGTFLSLLDPPAGYEEAAASCRQEGAYPVLVGAPDESDMMLGSPIILYDHPEIAPESAGDLFDGTEIDEILTLRILTMTDEEKLEVRQTDERARELLDRSERLTADDLSRLHGVVRQIRSVDGCGPPASGHWEADRA